MKKLLLSACLFLSSLSYGQTQRGALFLGPSVNYVSSKQTNRPVNSLNMDMSKYANLNAVMRLGYFVADNVAIGLIGGYGNSVLKNEWLSGSSNQMESSETVTNIISPGLFGRGYKLFNENKFGFFFQLSGTYQTGTSLTTDKTIIVGKTEISKREGKINGYTINLQPGFVYFVTKKIGVEFSVGNISYNKLKQENYFKGEKIATSTVDGMNVNFNGSSFYVGLNFYLD